jgi:hypothetical protein
VEQGIKLLEVRADSDGAGEEEGGKFVLEIVLVYS